MTDPRIEKLVEEFKEEIKIFTMVIKGRELITTREGLDWFNSELALARKEERERIVEMVKEMKKVPYDQLVGSDTGRAYAMGKSSGFNQALDDLLSKLEEEKT